MRATGQVFMLIAVQERLFLSSVARQSVITVTANRHFVRCHCLLRTLLLLSLYEDFIGLSRARDASARPRSLTTCFKTIAAVYKSIVVNKLKTVLPTFSCAIFFRTSRFIS
jgi:hypothetical protein